jgi:hypothetical protein
MSPTCTGAPPRRSARLRTAVIAAGTALVLSTGAAAAAEPRSAPRIDLSCYSSAAIHFGSAVTDTDHPVTWTATGTWDRCRNGDDQSAATGDAMVLESGNERLSCNWADTGDAAVSYDAVWADGRRSWIEGREVIDARQNGEGLIRFSGRVVRGAYAGDTFTETSTAATTGPRQCAAGGLTHELGEGSIVLSRP